VKEPDIGEDFVSLFAKVVIKTKQNAAAPTKVDCVKLLDAKRSQSIGILMTSQRLDSQLIRDALLGFDNQLIG
jgi:hypothetical protein